VAGHGSAHENDQNLYGIVVGKGNRTRRCNIDMCMDDNIKMSVWGIQNSDVDRNHVSKDSIDSPNDSDCLLPKDADPCM
jgi:hypothetical protein